MHTVIFRLSRRASAPRCPAQISFFYIMYTSPHAAGLYTCQDARVATYEPCSYYYQLICIDRRHGLGSVLGSFWLLKELSLSALLVSLRIGSLNLLLLSASCSTFAAHAVPGKMLLLLVLHSTRLSREPRRL